jgi:PKD repeat protein
MILASVSLLSCGVAGNDDPPPPHADFTAGCLTIADSLVTFSNLSTNASRYNWRFGNGDSSSERTPSVRYTDTGTYQILLLVENSAGVRDSITRSVRIVPHPPQVLTLDVPFVEQATYLFWWAAPIEMVLRYNGLAVDQCQIAMARLHSDCCNQQPDGCNVGTSVEDVQDAIYRSGLLQSQKQAGPMALDDIKKEIAQGRPIIALFSDGTYGYAMVIYGYDSSDNLYIHDPGSGSGTIPYLSSIQFSGYGWRYSIYCIRKE